MKTLLFFPVLALVGTMSLQAFTGDGTLTLLPPATGINRLTVTVTAISSGQTTSDTKTTDVTGTVNAAINADPTTGATTQMTVTDGDISLSNMRFVLKVFTFVTVADITTSNMGGTAFTPAPPAPITPNANGGTFDGSLHRILINRGTMDGTALGEPFTSDFAEFPIEGPGTGAGTITMVPGAADSTHRTFQATVTIPVDFTDTRDFDGTPGSIRVRGTISAAGPVRIPLNALIDWKSTTGLTGQYFNNSPDSANFNTLESLQAHASGLIPALVKNAPTLNFAYDGTGFPAPYNAGASNFESYYSGKLNLSAGGVYTFNTTSDDGSMLWIDGNLVVNNNFNQGVTTRTGSVTLAAGYHNIVVGFYQAGSSYGLYAQMSGPGDTTMVDINTGNASAQITPDIVLGSLAGAGDGALTTGNLITGADNTDTTFSGVISGIGDLNKWGSGTQTLTGANTYTGRTTVNAGLLKFVDNKTGSSNFVTHANLEFNVTTGVQQFNGGTLSGTGNLVKSGSGQMWLGANSSPQAVALTGASSVIDVQGGVLRNEYNNSAWGGNLAGLNVAGSAVFDLWDGNATVDELSGSGTINKGWSVSNTLTIGVNNGSGTFSGSIFNNRTDLGYGGTAGGNLSLVKNGSGTQILASSNTFNGGLNIVGGTVAAEGGGVQTGRLGQGSVTVNAGAVLRTDTGDSFGYYNGAPSGINVLGGTITTGGTGNFRTTLPNLSLTGGTVTSSGGNVGDGSGVFSINSGTTVMTNASAATSTISASTIGLNGSIVFTVADGSAAADLAVSSVLIGAYGGSGGVTKADAGTMQLTGANTYAGLTTLEGGVLNAATFSDYGVDGSLGNRAAVADALGDIGILFRGGTLQYTGSTAQSTNRPIRISTVGGATIDASGSNPSATLSFTATSSPNFFENPGARTLTLSGANTGANTFAMAIQEAGGATSVVKNGAGTWVLTGANAYTGGTTVNAGTLAVTGNSITDTGTLVINSGKVNLTGTETVNMLFYGVTQQVAGTYGSTSSSATFKNDTRFSGSGILSVTTGSAYDIWLLGFTFAPGANTTATGDPDNDGSNNLLEYVLNRNPSASDASIVPQLNASGSNLVFTFSRRTDSATGTTQVFHYGSTLTGWTDVSIVPGPQVTIGAPAGAVQLVTVTIPKAGQTRLFGRLQVMQP